MITFSVLLASLHGGMTDRAAVRRVFHLTFCWDAGGSPALQSRMTPDSLPVRMLSPTRVLRPKRSVRSQNTGPEMTASLVRPEVAVVRCGVQRPAGGPKQERKQRRVFGRELASCVLETKRSAGTC